MGCAMSRRCEELREESRLLRAKIRALEEEITEMRRRGDDEARSHRQREAAMEEKWERQGRRHREEAGALRKKLEDQVEEGRRRELLEDVLAATVPGGACRLVVEQMKTEQERREQAVEKWKQLYLAIKAELDALILRTKQGERLCWVAEEEVIQRMRRELEAKEEMDEALRARLADMELEGVKRDREVDILRQSLRILSSSSSSSNKKRNHGRKHPVISLRFLSRGV